MSRSSGYFTCIGAQKAGTSWLQSYLSRSNDVYLPEIKEMHFFDSLFLPKNLVGDFWDIAFEERCIKSLKSKRYRLADAYLERLKIGGSLYKYRDYFYSKSGDYKALGDITPAYSMLGKEGFEAIKVAFPDAKIIFMLRNPVDRYWSYLRMQLKKNKNYPLEEKFYKVIDNPHVSLRSDYERTMRCLEEIFPDNQVLYIFYEDLFGERHENCLEEISSFLGIEKNSVEEKDKKINFSQPVDMKDEMRSFAANKFSNVYGYVEERLGRIPEAWMKDKLLLC